MKKARSVILFALVGILIAAITAQAAVIRYAKGDKIQDFTFSTYDGQSYSLYELMQNKEAVLLNIWASWCPPCRREFPFMQEAYEEYQDLVEVIALSCEAADTPEILSNFAKENGLTFKIGQAPQELINAIGVSSIPVSLMIDRYGTICFMQAGAQPDTDTFRRLFDAFLGDEYTESVVLDAIPSEKPAVSPSAPSDLTAALSNPSSNPANKYVWPMVVTEKDGRVVVASTNESKESTRSEVTAAVEAKAGDAIVVTFKTSTEALFDLMAIAVNGETVKRFGGEHDWMTYAIPVDTDGVQQVKISYIKDRISDGGEDMIWVDSIQVAENAQAALAANPVYPFSLKTEILVSNPQAQEVVISDPAGVLQTNFGQVRCYVVNGDTANMEITLSKDVDPECALVYFSYDSAQMPISQIITDEGYSADTKVDSAQDTSAYCTYVAVYPDVQGGTPVTTMLFRDEDNLKQFVTLNFLGDWQYVSEDANAEDAVPQEQSVYTIQCKDQNGNPVQGVLLQVCNDEVCQVFVTDDEGKVTFEADAFAWEIHVLQAPEGYLSDSAQVIYAPLAGGDVNITLNRY